MLVQVQVQDYVEMQVQMQAVADAVAEVDAVKGPMHVRSACKGAGACCRCIC